MTASSAAIRAGRAYVEMSIDDRKIGPGLERVRQGIQAQGLALAAIGSAVTAAGIAALAGLTKATLDFANAGSQLDDISQRTGASVEALSGLAYAAEQSGTSLETVEGALRKMQVHLSQAANSADGNSEALARLGLSADQLRGLSVDQQFLVIGDAISKMGNESDRTALLLEIFGKSGAQLKPLFRDGADGVKQLLDRARELGLVMSGEAAAAAALLGDRSDELSASLGGLRNTIGAALAPTLTKIITAITETVALTSAWVAQNPALVTGLAMVAAGVVTVGATATAAGLMMIGLATTINVVTAAGTAMKVLFAPELLLIQGAVLAIIAALAAAIGLFTYFSGVGSIIGEGVLALIAALGAGNIEDAWEIITTTMQLAWLEALQFIEDALRTMYRNILDESVKLAKKMKIPVEWIVPAMEGAQVDPINMQREAEILKLRGALDQLRERQKIEFPKVEVPKIELPKLEDLTDQMQSGFRPISIDLGEMFPGLEFPEWDPRPTVPPTVTKQIADAAEALPELSSRGGTFSAFAVRGLTGSRVLDDIAKNTKETVEAIEDLSVDGLTITA